MGVINFFKKHPFVRNILFSILGAVFFLWLVFFMMNYYTLHGKTVEVPDFKGVSVARLEDFVKGKEVTYLVIDSIFDAKAEKGVVLKQDPEPQTMVKKDRTIYLYVTAVMPPQVAMPKLQDKSLRQAVSLIETYGLRLGRIKYKADQCSNCVLEQQVKGVKVEIGKMVPKGTIVDLLVGKGLGDEQITIPYLIGYTRQEAFERLGELSLLLGSVSYDVPSDSLKSKVYKQFPVSGNERYINSGASIDIFLTTDNSKFPSLLEDTLSLEAE
ncbi:MAG: PASTA domain-containing protein [Bacteroidetes bacterium]|nr:PASTA domain-containing protein [Bacteroidota bacterium]